MGEAHKPGALGKEAGIEVTVTKMIVRKALEIE
jgi:hypothetical protein